MFVISIVSLLSGMVKENRSKKKKLLDILSFLLDLERGNFIIIIIFLKDYMLEHLYSFSWFIFLPYRCFSNDFGNSRWKSLLVEHVFIFLFFPIKLNECVKMKYYAGLLWFFIFFVWQKLWSNRIFGIVCLIYCCDDVQWKNWAIYASKILFFDK